MIQATWTMYKSRDLPRDSSTRNASLKALTAGSPSFPEDKQKESAAREQPHGQAGVHGGARGGVHGGVHGRHVWRPWTPNVWRPWTPQLAKTLAPCPQTPPWTPPWAPPWRRPQTPALTPTVGTTVAASANTTMRWRTPGMSMMMIMVVLFVFPPSPYPGET